MEEHVKPSTSQENILAPEEQGKFELKRELLFITMFATNMFAFMTFGLIAPLFPSEGTRKGVSYTIQVGKPRTPIFI